MRVFYQTEEFQKSNASFGVKEQPAKTKRRSMKKGILLIFPCLFFLKGQARERTGQGRGKKRKGNRGKGTGQDQGQDRERNEKDGK
jgi:hypothetical protein